MKKNEETRRTIDKQKSKSRVSVLIWIFIIQKKECMVLLVESLAEHIHRKMHDEQVKSLPATKNDNVVQPYERIRNKI